MPYAYILHGEINRILSEFFSCGIQNGGNLENDESCTIYHCGLKSIFIVLSRRPQFKSLQVAAPDRLFGQLGSGRKQGDTEFSLLNFPFFDCGAIFTISVILIP